MSLIDIMDWQTSTPNKTSLEERRLKSMNIRTDGDKSIPTQWAIRHKPSGHFMALPLGYGNRGGSFWDHTLGQAKEVRLFRTERAAKIALSAWLLGKHIPEWDDGCVYVGSIDSVDSRKRDEMEVVEIDLVPRVKLEE